MRQAFEDVARSCEIRVFEFLVSGAGLKPAAELSDVEPQRLWRGQPSRRERRCAAGRRWLLVHEVVAEVVEDLLESPCSRAVAAPGQGGAASDASATADAWMLVSDLGAQPYRENAAGATGVTPAWICAAGGSVPRSGRPCLRPGSQRPSLPALARCVPVSFAHGRDLSRTGWMSGVSADLEVECGGRRHSSEGAGDCALQSC